MNNKIYLDSAATTKPYDEVIDVMIPYLKEQWYNPSSLYSPSQNVKDDIEIAKETIERYINAESHEIYFTSSGSEANCWAIQGFVKSCLKNNIKPIIITSIIEHKSIIECCEDLLLTFSTDIDVYYCDVDIYGFIDFDRYVNLLETVRSDNEDFYNYKVLVSIQFANNEIGTIQDVIPLCETAHKYGCLFHTDAVQAFGHTAIDVKALNVDMLSVSAHKISGPKGIGFLYISNNAKNRISPLIYGSQENNMRGGTENVPYIIGFAEAIKTREEIELAKYKIDYLYIYQRILKLRNYLISELKNCGCKLNGSNLCRLYNNINVILPINSSAESFIYLMDSSGICVSAGSACNSHSYSVSYVLKAIGLSEEEAMRSIRITLPDDITFDEINIFLEEASKAIKLLKNND